MYYSLNDVHITSLHQFMIQQLSHRLTGSLQVFYAYNIYSEGACSSFKHVADKSTMYFTSETISKSCFSCSESSEMALKDIIFYILCIITHSLTERRKEKA